MKKKEKRIGVIISDETKKYVNFFSSVVLFLISIIMLLMLFAITACSSKTEIVEKPVIVYKPVPTNCDFNITRPPVIDTNSTHSLLSSITELSIDSVMLRKQIKAVPCLNVFEIK